MNTPPISPADSAAITQVQNSPAEPVNEIQRADEQRPPQPSPDVQLELNSGNLQFNQDDAQSNIESSQQAQDVTNNVVNLIQSDPELAYSAQSGVNNALAEAALKVAN